MAKRDKETKRQRDKEAKRQRDKDSEIEKENGIPFLGFRLASPLPFLLYAV